jgi:hypothetical protein
VAAIKTSICWSYREADVETADLETMIIDLLDGQYRNPVKIVALNTAEGWSQDVSEEPPKRCTAVVICNCATFRRTFKTVSSGYEGHDPQLNLRLAYSQPASDAVNRAARSAKPPEHYLNWSCSFVRNRTRFHLLAQHRRPPMAVIGDREFGKAPARSGARACRKPIKWQWHLILFHPGQSALNIGDSNAASATTLNRRSWHPTLLSRKPLGG